MEKSGLGQHGSCPCRGPASIGIARKFEASGEAHEVNFRGGFYGGLIVATIWGVWVALLWQPERQLRLHSVHLIEQIEKRNWSAVAEFVDVTYQDRWQNDRTRFLERLHEVFRMLPNARIEASLPSIRTRDSRGYWSAKIRIKSRGEFADYIESRVNSLDEPFEFEWHRGTWPWNWKLLSVRNSALEIPY